MGITDTGEQASRAQSRYGPHRPSPAKFHIPPLGEEALWPPEEIRRLRIEFLNLLCATDLPDTADLNIHACLKKLDEWTQQVKAETQRCMHQFHRDPADYENSEAYFRVLMMITVLQKDLGVRYDPDCIKTPKFLKSTEGFLHGVLNGHGGTCANMPVLYAAVGRKLGYPIYLCSAKGHFFCRWASKHGRERFNIEASGLGLSVYPDDYYMEWPRKITPREVRQGFYLRNLDPAEELAHFLTIRGHCLHDTGHLLDAIAAYSLAHRLAPAEPHHFAVLMGALNDELKAHAQGELPNSYRQWEDFERIARPQAVRNVLNDDFPRIDKSRPPFRPTQPIEAR